MEARNDDLLWLPQVFDIGFSVLAARNIEPRELLLRARCVPDSLRLRTRAQAAADEQESPGPGTMIRAGASGHWTYAVDPIGGALDREPLLQSVSAGTSAACITVTADATAFFTYAEDTELVCSFDPVLPHLRHGVSPDRFLEQMEAVGMFSPEDSGYVERMLHFAHQLLDLRLPRETVAESPLLAGYLPRRAW